MFGNLNKINTILHKNKVMAQLTPEELKSIKDSQSKYNQTIFEIGASEAQILAFQQGIEKLQEAKKGLLSDWIRFGLFWSFYSFPLIFTNNL